jgi:putative transposase
MDMNTSRTLYKVHRFPAVIVSHSVWLYFPFALSYSDIEEMMARTANAIIAVHRHPRCTSRENVWLIS